MLDWDPYDIAIDLTTCDSELEVYDVEEIIPFIDDWLQLKKVA